MSPRDPDVAEGGAGWLCGLEKTFIDMLPLFPELENFISPSADAHIVQVKLFGCQKMLN